MSTPDTPAQALPYVENLFLSLLEKVEANGQARQSASGRAWLRPAAQAILNLPWGETGLPDDRKPPRYDTAVELLLFMLRNLDDDTPPPTSVNVTGEGGATAQWHLEEYDLEIFCEPDEPPEYSVKTPHTEHEGPVRDEGERNQLRAHLRLMPGKHRE